MRRRSARYNRADRPEVEPATDTESLSSARY